MSTHSASSKIVSLLIERALHSGFDEIDVEMHSMFKAGGLEMSETRPRHCEPCPSDLSLEITRAPFSGTPRI